MLNSLVWTLRLLPAEILLKSNIQLLTPTSRCVGSCQQKLRDRLNRSDSKASIHRYNIGNDAFSDDDEGSPIMTRRFLQQKQISIPNKRIAVTPPRLNRINPVVPNSAPVLRYRSVLRNKSANLQDSIKTPDNSTGSTIGPTPYPAGHAQLMLQNQQNVNSPRNFNVYQKMREKASKADSPLAEYFQDADISQKLSFESDSEDSISPKNHENSRNLSKNAICQAIVHPNNHLDSSMNRVSSRTRRNSRNTSRSPLPSPLSNPQNSHPQNSLSIPQNSPIDEKVEKNSIGSTKKLQLFGNTEKKLRQRRPNTPQSPDPNTPEKIQRFQSRLRRFRPNGTPNESLNGI